MDLTWFDDVWGGITAVATIIGAAAGIYAFYPAWSSRLKVKRIVDRHDSDLVAIWELQSRLFAPHDVDNLDDLQDWVEQNGRGNKLPGERQQHFVVLVLKVHGVVCGFLYAQYFPLRQTGFLGYLVIDREKLEAHDIFEVGALILLKEMLKDFDKTGHPWRYVITEVQQFPDSNNVRARAKLRLFRNAARKLSLAAKRDVVEVFKLPVDYQQPPLDEERFAETDLATWTNPHWLLLAPRRKSDLGEADGEATLSAEQAAHLLETLLVYCYGENYPDNAQYRAYLEGMLAEYRSKMPDPLVLDRRPS